MWSRSAVRIACFFLLLSRSLRKPGRARRHALRFSGRGVAADVGEECMSCCCGCVTFPVFVLQSGVAILPFSSCIGARGVGEDSVTCCCCRLAVSEVLLVEHDVRWLFSSTCVGLDGCCSSIPQHALARCTQTCLKCLGQLM